MPGIKGQGCSSRRNGEALKKLVTEHGVTLHETPTDFIKAYMQATEKILDKYPAVPLISSTSKSTGSKS